MTRTTTSRLALYRSDLAAIVREGPRPRDWLPASDGLFLRGKRHLISASAKSGKSIATLSHAVEMALHGARIAILDRENGADEYGRRMESILRGRDLDGAARVLVTDAVAHFDWPPCDALRDPSYVEALADVDLVVFDSSRGFLTLLGLKEDGADDYAEFMSALVDPLHRAGVATLVLDNTGHDGRRARGSSSKADLNEVVFALDGTERFDADMTGAVTLKRTHTRFGGGPDMWRMTLGGGAYTAWSDGAREAASGALHDAVVSVLISATEPMSQNAVLVAVAREGVSVGRKATAIEKLKRWASEPASPIARDGSGYVLGG
jgi:hypothetical protein